MGRPAKVLVNPLSVRGGTEVVKPSKKIKDTTANDNAARAKAIQSKLSSAYITTIDETEKKFSLSSGDMSDQKTPTGLVILDFYLDGGYSCGMVSISGRSTSGKSTLGLLGLGNALKLEVPYVVERDAEGSVSADKIYAAACMRQPSIRSVFGEKAGGKWIVPPRATYSRSNIIEDLFDSTIYALNRMPDKIYNAERDKWFLRVKVGDKRTEHFIKTLGTPDPKLSDKKFKWYETDNPYAQAYIAADSYPSFQTRDADEKEEQSRQRAQQAAAYSDNIKRLVGKLSSKYVIWVGINQLRKNPAAKGHQDPWYRPCGEAIYFYANTLLDMRPISTPEKWQNVGNQFKDTKYKKSFEPSVEREGRLDRYSYKQIKIEKNKLGLDGVKMVIRVHEKDHTGKGRGVDCVYDMFQFLEVIGVVKMKNQKGEKVLVFAADHKTIDMPFAGKTLTWSEFKLLVLADIYRDKSVVDKAMTMLKKLFKLEKAFSFKKWAYSKINNGMAKGWYEDIQIIKENKAMDFEAADEE